MTKATLDAVAAHAGNEKKSPMVKLLAASAAPAQRRLRTASSKLEAVIPSHAVVFDKVMRGKGQAPARVVFRWPGVLMLLDAESGEITCESWAPSMHREMPQAVAFMAQRQRGRPLVKVRFQPPQGVRLVATFWPDGVVRVHAAKGGELLAESEPGQPTVLRSGFQSLAAADLAPRLS